MIFRKIADFFKKYYFLILALLSFILPDLQLRSLVIPKTMDIHFTFPVSIGFTFAVALFIVFICWLVLPKNAGKIVYAIISSFFIILSFSQYIYFKIFKKFFWIKAIGLSKEATGYLGFALQNIDMWLLSFTFLSILSLVFAIIKWKKTNLSWIKGLGISCIPLCAICLIHTFMVTNDKDTRKNEWDSWKNPYMVYNRFNDANKCIDVCGFNWTTIRDLYHTVVPSKYSEDDFEKVESFFEEKEVPLENEYSGIFEGKNLIVFMMESIDTWVINKKYTPTIYKMMNEGISFTNYYSPFFGEGHTFNAEFAFNTGYLTPRSAVNATAFASNKFPYALPQLFKEKGYRTNSYHFNDSEFYNRGTMHQNFGYEKYNSFSELGVEKEASKYDGNILESGFVYEHMTSGEPFFDFVITYSAHLPYSKDNELLETIKAKHPELIDTKMEEEQNNCLILATETDKLFSDLLKKLEENDALDNTVIIAYTDHYTYGYPFTDRLIKLKKRENIYKVPAFIYYKGIDKEKINKPMMPVDWVPTIANLFNLDKNQKYIGNDIFDTRNKGFVIFGNSQWLDSRKYFDPESSTYSKSEEKYIMEQNKKVEKLFTVNDIVVIGDYFGKISSK